MCERETNREREDEGKGDREREEKRGVWWNFFIAERCLFRDSCQYLKVSPARIDFSQRRII